ncbi:MAG: PQQ-binding-like beta-propeller repeat protein [Candidatus Lokiarchaeota archaeon]|nr:PQQ-binding-like beta-propeller repeat protein [Candidatus Lokiarchaeota archaeon]
MGFAINGEDGSESMDFNISYLTSNSPAIGDIDSNGWLDIVTANEYGWVVSATGYDKIGTHANELWEIDLGDEIFSSPSLGDLDGDGKLEIVIGCYDNRTYALNGEDGPVAWNYTTGGSMHSSPVIADLDADGKLELVVGSFDKNIYVLNPSISGNQIAWQALSGDSSFKRCKFLEITPITNPIPGFPITFVISGIIAVIIVMKKKPKLLN